MDFNIKNISKPSNIFLVDDQELTAILLRRQLSAETDFIVHATKNPRQAIALAEQISPIVIILDILMPLLDGLTLLRQFRLHKEFQDVPIIMLSSDEDAQQKALSFESGANDYLIKFPEPVEMLARVRYHARAYLNLLANRQAQESLKESEHRFRVVTDSVTEAIIALDVDGRITFWNHGSRKIFGYKKSEILGKQVWGLIPERFHAAYRMEFENFIKKEKKHQNEAIFECVGLDKNGGEFLLELSINTWIEGGQNYFVSVLRDITKRKQVEEKMTRQATQLLEMEKSASRAKSDFVANLSHEIRTPMNAILCLTDLALRSGVDSSSREYLLKIDNASQSLMGCLNDILDFSKIEAGKLELYPVLFDPAELFKKLADMFGGQAADKGLELVFVLPESYFQTLFGDAKRLEQVLINLLRNAIKFTSQGNVIVRAHDVHKQVGSVQLHFSVEDTGIGIDAEHVGKLFVPFAQVDASISLKYGGTGLGLNICKQLVHLMGGEIWAESVLGQGSIFHFTVTFEYHSQSRKALIVPESLRQIKILVADDHELTREMMEEMLKGFGFEAYTVDSGEEALKELLSAHMLGFRYDLLFLDWRMAGMDGIETAKALRQKFADQSALDVAPKIILLTAFGKNTIQKSAEQSGIDMLVHKPVTRIHLFNAILEVFGFSSHKNLTDTHTEIAVLNEELEAARKIGGARVLLAEDNFINQQVARELLERVGVQVEIVENGQEALNRLEHATFDVVLMDVQMPIMDGYTATRQIRSQAKFKNLPIIAMTAHIMESAREASLAAGMNDYIAKPIDIKRLYSVLSQCICLDEDKPAVQSFSQAEPDYLPESLDGVDIKSAMARFAGSQKFYKSMLLRFKEYANIGDKIQAALKNRDVDTARNFAHMITGIAGNLSAIYLQQAAHELEMAIEQDRLDQVPILLVTFGKELSRVINSIATLIPSEVQTQAALAIGEELPNRVVLEPIVRELAGFLVAHDTDAEITLETMKTLLTGDFWEDELQKMEERIQRLDYAGAMDSLILLARALQIPMRKR
ncbi:MAG: response regulator [Magnetococcus sp. DMHC-6]